MLSWVELSEVVLEVETQLNRRPLSYVEDDVQHPVLTPASFLFQRANRLLSWSLGEKRTVIYENERNTLNHAKMHFGNVGRGSTLPHSENDMAVEKKGS